MRYDDWLTEELEDPTPRRRRTDDDCDDDDDVDTDCGIEIESGDSGCDHRVFRRPVCDECRRAESIAADLAAWVGMDGGAAGVRVRAYLDGRDLRRAARRALRAVLNGDERLVRCVAACRQYAPTLG
jgi:hypothetical protein